MSRLSYEIIEMLRYKCNLKVKVKYEVRDLRKSDDFLIICGDILAVVTARRLTLKCLGR